MLDAWYVMKMNQDMVCIEEKILVYRNDLPYIVRPFKKKLEAVREICRAKEGQPRLCKMYINGLGVIRLFIPKLVLN